VRTDPSHSESKSESGFVLPYVLVMIAILAIVGTIAAERLQRTLKIVAQIEEQSRVQMNFASAEAEAIFALITSTPVDGGYNLNRNAARKTDFGYFAADGFTSISKEDYDLIEQDLWSGAGGRRAFRISDTSHVLVEYQDISGLASWNGTNPKTLEKILMGVGLSKDISKSLLARLGDYTDEDNARRFRGAERSDYRLRQLPPPSNAPIRTYNELYSVMGWEDALTPVQLNRLKDWTTFEVKSTLRGIFIPTSLQTLLKPKNALEAKSNTSQDLFANTGAVEVRPSGKWRLTFSQSLSSGGATKRVIEVVPQLQNTEIPFRKFWVYEQTVLSDPSAIPSTELSEIKDVLTATPARP